MKITLNQQILAGGNAVNENPNNFSIDGQRNIQILKTVRSPHVQTFDRGNLQIMTCQNTADRVYLGSL